MPLQNGSFFQSLGKPIADVSTLGYLERRSLSLSWKVLVGIIVSKKYAITPRIAYILRSSRFDEESHVREAVFVLEPSKAVLYMAVYS